MVTYYVKKDDIYKLTATVNCAIYDSSGATIITCDAGEKVSFKAPTSKISVSDDNASLIRLVDESSGGGGGMAEHIANSTIHVSGAEKSNWNSAVDSVTTKHPVYDSHIDNSTAHITADERARWNSMSSDVGSNTGAINAHISDSTIHLTEEKVESMLHDELYVQGEHRTTNGADNFNAHAFEISNPPIGEISQIIVPCRSTTSASNNMYVATPVYLSVFQKDGDGNWNHIATSANAITQTAGTTAYYTFYGLSLTGMPIRLIIVTDDEDSSFNPTLIFGARVTAAPDKGLAYTDQTLSASREYIIDVTFIGASVTEKYAPISHIGSDSHIKVDERTTWNGTTDSFNTHSANTDIHITAAEREAWNAALSGGSDTSSFDELHVTSLYGDVDDNILNVNSYAQFNSKVSFEGGVRKTTNLGAELLDDDVLNKRESDSLYAPKNYSAVNAILITDANGNVTASTIISVAELNTLNNNLTNISTKLAEFESRIAALETT